MGKTRQYTALIEREGDAFVALCPALDIASQGSTVEEARANLIEAIELFFESADPEEAHARAHEEYFVTRVEITMPDSLGPDELPRGGADCGQDPAGLGAC